MNITIEPDYKRRTECSTFLNSQQREEVLRKSALMNTEKVDIYCYSPTSDKIDSKSKLIRQLGDVVDLSTFDFQTGRSVTNPSHLLYLQRSSYNKRQLIDNQQNQSQKHQFEYRSGIRPDASLVPPIRQTASIFKQPVTVYRTDPNRPQDPPLKSDLKHSTQEKPKQLFWEKRLEGMIACDVDGFQFNAVDLPNNLKPVGPNVNNETLLQSLATALHVTPQQQPVIGQTAPLEVLQLNAGVYLNPDQPLMYSVNITDDDIRLQEERVQLARRKLQEALDKE